MKKILPTIIICLLFACSKSNQNDSANTVSYSGTLTIGPVVRHLSNYSVPSNVPGSNYLINDAKVSSSMPVCYTQGTGNSTALTVIMSDVRPDTLSKIQFGIPKFGTFSNFNTAVFIEIGGQAFNSTASVSFVMPTSGTGTFAMTGKSKIPSGDSVNFSFNGSFKNL